MALFSPMISTFAENKSPKVVVVGAGLAGLTTAYRLNQKGLDVFVYEARNRVGGRVLSVEVDGKIAELGGQNIADGGEAENMLGLIKELGFQLTGDKVGFDRFYFEKDRLIPAKQILSNRKFDSENLKCQLFDLAQRSQNMREVLNGILEKEDPLYKMLSIQLAAYEGGTVDQLSAFYTETLYQMLLGGICAAHQGNAQEETCIDFFSIEGGNSSLPEKMAEKLKDRLHLNKPLAKVAKDPDGTFILTFKDDEKVQADILVLAMPCSVYDDLVFEKDVVPNERLDLIKNVQYGTHAKILVPFDISPPKRMSFCKDCAVSFFDPHLTTLTLYYTGIASMFSKETIFDAYKQGRPMIELGLGGICPPLVPPVFAEDRSYACYDGPVGYSWSNDPYAKGSYSYIASGYETVLTGLIEEQRETVKALFAPIDQKLYFAGEHASILMEVGGTMEAACESGERVARMILNSLHPITQDE